VSRDIGNVRKFPTTALDWTSSAQTEEVLMSPNDAFIGLLVRLRTDNAILGDAGGILGCKRSLGTNGQAQVSVD
jgi:hypothetical protein